MAQMYWIIPVEGGGRPDNTLPQPPLGIWGGGGMPYPDQGLPGGQGGRPSQPIYHPGHPDHGLPAHPDHGLPGGSGGRPDQGLPPFPSQGLPPGGTDIPSNELPMPEPPPDHADDIIVAVHRPGEEWVVKAYDADARPDQGLPGSQPHPSHPIAPGSPPRPDQGLPPTPQPQRRR